jgi:O-antigen/teichoic acid export membrane protein
LKKKFLINLALLVILNLLIKPFWVFGIDRTVQNLVGLSEYGLLFALFNLSVVFNIFLDIGLNNYNSRSVSQNSSSIYTYFPNIVVVKLLLAVIYAVITFSAAFLLGYEGRCLKLLSLLTINQFLLSFIMYLRSNISGLQYYTTDSILSVADRFFMLICCLLAYVFYFCDHLVTIEWFVVLQTFSYILSAITIGVVLISKTGRIPFRFQWKISGKVIRESFPYALLIFLMAAYSRIDSIMLERLLPGGSEQTGVYAQSFRILDSVVMMAILFAGLLLPMFSKMISQKSDLVPFTRMAFNIIWVIAVTFSLASIFYSGDIFALLYKDGGTYSAKVFSILILTFMPISVINIFGTLITASGNLRYMNITAFFSLLINIGLNFILIPHFFALGAAVSSLVTQLFVAISQVLIVRKQFNTIFFQPLNVLVFTMGTLIVSLGIWFLLPVWFVGFISIGISGILLGIITRLLPLKEMKNFFMYNTSPENS